MGCWWLDEEPYPGPTSSISPKEFQAAASRVGTHLHSTFSRFLAEAARQYGKQAEALLKTAAAMSEHSASSVPPIQKIAPTKTSNVGPRTTRQFDRRGRRKY